MTLLDDSNFLIGERHYRLVSDYREGFNAEKLGERYSDVLARYDYIVGDWGYEQLRLKGFSKRIIDGRIQISESIPWKTIFTNIAILVVRILSSRESAVKKKRQLSAEKEKNHNRAYIDEKKGPVASNRKNRLLKIEKQSQQKPLKK